MKYHIPRPEEIGEKYQYRATERSAVSQIKKGSEVLVQYRATVLDVTDTYVVVNQEHEDANFPHCVFPDEVTLITPEQQRIPWMPVQINDVILHPMNRYNAIGVAVLDDDGKLSIEWNDGGNVRAEHYSPTGPRESLPHLLFRNGKRYTGPQA